MPFPYGNDMRYPGQPMQDPRAQQFQPPPQDPFNWQIFRNPGSVPPPANLPTIAPDWRNQIYGNQQNLGPGVLQQGFQDDPMGSFGALYQWLSGAGADPHQAYLKAAGKTGAMGGGDPLMMLANLLNNPQYGYLEHMAGLNQAAAARPGPPQPANVNPFGLSPTNAGPSPILPRPASPFTAQQGPTFQGPTPQWGQGAPPKMGAPVNSGYAGAPPGHVIFPNQAGGGNPTWGGAMNSAAATPPQSAQPFRPPVYPNFQETQPQQVGGYWRF